jgi:hypothetical protein
MLEGPFVSLTGAFPLLAITSGRSTSIPIACICTTAPVFEDTNASPFTIEAVEVNWKIGLVALFWISKDSAVCDARVRIAIPWPVVEGGKRKRPTVVDAPTPTPRVLAIEATEI